MQYSDEGGPERIDTIVVSTQHDEFMADDEQMLAQIRYDVINILMPRVKEQIHSRKVLALFGDDIKYFVNPTGKFVIGGPHGDTGLTGRKIIVDTYGGRAPTAAVPSRARTPRRWTARQLMPHATSPRTWWQRALPTRCWCS